MSSRVQLGSESVDPFPVKLVNILPNPFQYFIDQATDVPLNVLYYIRFPQKSMTTTSEQILIMLIDLPGQASSGHIIPARVYHSHSFRHTIAT